MADHFTKDQQARLRAELAELEGPKRAAAVESIATARGHGDLSENFEYHAAKNEQGMLERRIAMLRARLDGAVIVDAGSGEIVTVGSHVVVADETAATITFEVSSLGGEGTVSPSSPLGRVLLGRRVGETVEVPAPTGPWPATIVKISATLER